MRILKIAVLVLLVLILSLVTYIYVSVPALPEGGSEVVEEVLKNPVPEVIRGTTGYALNKGVKVWYERVPAKDSTKGSILLIMGIATDAFGWPHKFMDLLADSGYQVIRFDHRGTGMSDWMENWNKANAYSLLDMAEDGIAVLDTLGIPKAHVVGLSMGGMIAQEMAIHHPERVATLTSVMSSGYIEDPDLPKISSAVAFQLVRAGLKYGIVGGERNMLKLNIATRVILRGKADYEINMKSICEDALYNIRKRRGYNPMVSFQHQQAVKLSGSRYDGLKHLNIPTLVIHGKADPFIPIEHGKKCASIIPHADTCWLDGLAHDIPDVFADTLTKKIRMDFRRVIK
jgi:pimeloyl-ACP methyl ester carboxylesterase